MAWGVDRLRAVPPELVGLTLAGAGLRFHRIGEESLWNDEFASMHDALALDAGFLVESHRPLYYVLLRGWIGLFGTSEAAMRSLSAVLGTATVVVVYLLGRELFDRRVGAIAAALVVFSRFHLRWSQDVRMYALLALLAAASYLGFVRYLHRDDGGTRAAYAGVSALLLYTHLYGLFVVVAQNVHVALRVARGRRDGVDRRRWLGTQAAIAALALPVLVSIGSRAVGAATGERDVLRWLDVPHPLEVLWIPAQHLYGSRNLVVVAVVIVGLAAVLVDAVREPSRRRPAHTMLWSWLLAVVAIPLAVSVVLRPILALRYTIAALPAVAILTADGIAGVMDRIDARFVRRMFALGLVIALIPPAAAYYEEPTRAQWRETVAYVEQRASANDTVLVAPGYTKKNYEYYAERPDLRVLGVNASGDLEWLAGSIRGSDDVWVVASQNLDEPTMRRLHHHLSRTTLERQSGDGRAAVVEVVATPDARSFHRVGVVRYETRRGGGTGRNAST